MPGYYNHARIASSVVAAEPATAEGILLDLGAFPAMVHGRGLVKGVLLQLDSTLDDTDRIEGYRGDRESSLYVRERITVTLDDGQIISAWSYFFAHPEHIKHKPRLLVKHDGDLPVHAWRSAR